MATLILDNGKSDSMIFKQNKGLFEKLGIEVIKPSPYNSQSKFTERFFRSTARSKNSKINNALFIHN